MRAVLALFRSHLRSALTYRLEFLFSVGGVAVMMAATFFGTRALQPTMARTIGGEGSDYFGFVLMGMVAVTMLQTAVTAIPGAVGGGIRSGTLEAMLATPTPMPVLLAGMTAYPFAWSLVRCLLMVGMGAALGVHVAWRGIPLASLVLVLLLVPYIAFGVAAAAAVLTFRTAGPVPQALIMASTLLGGVYYPTRVIPGWLEHVSDFLPLSYGLRALRRVLFTGEGFAAVWLDVRMLVAMAVTASALAVVLLGLALRHARRTGTLSQY